MTKLTRSVEAHLKPLPARLAVEHAPALPESSEEQLTHARQRGLANNASFVLWLDRPGAIRVLAPGLDNASWSVDGLDHPEGSVDWCEAIAVMVHSDVAALLPAPAAAEVSGADPPTKDQSAEPTPLPDTAEIASSRMVQPTPQSTHIWLGASIGYSPSWPASDATAMHGAQINVGVGFGYYVGFHVQGEIKKPLDLAVGGDRVQWVDWPVRLLIRGLLPAGRFQIGVAAGGVMTVSYLRSLDRMPMHKPTAATRINLGATVLGSARYWMLPWLGIVLDGGLDIYRDRVQYTLGEETVLEVKRIRPSFVLGAIARFSVAGE